MNASSAAHKNRLQLARALSRAAGAGVAEILATPEHPGASPCSLRIGFTGPPGAGKSTLLGAWARGRLERGNRGGGASDRPEQSAHAGLDPG